MSYLFITYDRDNRELALEISEELLNEGSNVWIDLDEQRSSIKSWKRALVGIKECEAVLVVKPPADELSQWVKTEVAVAEKWGKEIIILPQLDETLGTISFKGTSSAAIKVIQHSDNAIVLNDKTLGRDITRSSLILSAANQREIEGAYLNNVLPFETSTGWERFRHRFVDQVIIRVVTNVIASVIVGIVIFIAGSGICWGLINGFRKIPLSSPPTLHPIATIHPQCNANPEQALLVLGIRVATGARVFNGYDDNAVVGVHQFQKTEAGVDNILIAHAQLEHNGIWFLVEHPTEADYYGWVMESEVSYNRESLLCLPIFERQIFTQRNYPVWNAETPRG